MFFEFFACGRISIYPTHHSLIASRCSRSECGRPSSSSCQVLRSVLEGRKMVLPSPSHPFSKKILFWFFGRSGTRAGKILTARPFKIPSGHPQAYISTCLFRPLGRVLGVYTWSPDDQRLPEPSCVLYSSVAACTSKVPDGPQRFTRGARLVPATKACLSKVN